MKHCCFTTLLLLQLVLPVALLAVYGSHGTGGQLACLLEFLGPQWIFFILLICTMKNFFVSLSATFSLALAWLIAEDATLSTLLNFTVKPTRKTLLWTRHDVNFDIVSKAKHALVILVGRLPWGEIFIQMMSIFIYPIRSITCPSSSLQRFNYVPKPVCPYTGRSWVRSPARSHQLLKRCPLPSFFQGTFFTWGGIKGQK